ncbi:MAG: S41 family peptidase [Pseudomonadota bacterium]
MLAWFMTTAVAWGAPADDLTDLAALLEAAHPTLDAPALREAVQREMPGLDALPGDPRDAELAFGAAVSRVVASLGDAHVYVGLPMMQPQATIEPALLPVLVRTVEGQVLLDAATFPFDPGTALIAIDDVPIQTIFDEARTLVAADGRDPTAIRRALDYDLPRYYALTRGMASDYVLTLVLPDGSRVLREVPAAGRAEARTMQTSRHSATWWGSGEPTPRLAWSGTVAVLTMASFGAQDMDGYARAVDGLMAGIPAGAPIVVDLRGNQGGYRPNANALLRHLVDGTFAEWTSMRTSTRRIPRRWRGRLQFPFGTDRERLRDFERSPDGFVFDGDPLQMQGVGTHLGPLVLLVDARTGSAANGFVLMVRNYRPDAHIVGESLGGACDRHVGELPVVWTGEDSGVVVMFSLIEAMHLAVPGCTPGRGLAPDHAVELNIEQFAGSEDPWMEVALRLVAPTTALDGTGGVDDSTD